jgi:hypothetical protein
VTDENVVQHDGVVTAGDAMAVVGKRVVEDVDALGNAGCTEVLGRRLSIHHANAGIDIIVDEIVGDLEETIG